jgi:hypothetical protein
VRSQLNARTLDGTPLFVRLGSTVLRRFGSLFLKATLACWMLLDCAAPAQPSAATLAGCYALERRDGRQRPLGLDLPDTLLLSPIVNRNPDGEPNPQYPLKLEVLALRPDAGRDSLRLDATHVVPWPPAWQTYFTVTAWRFRAPDSVQATLGGAMITSWDIQMRALGDSLAGIAQEYSDVVGGHPRIPVIARRTKCPKVDSRRRAI